MSDHEEHLLTFARYVLTLMEAREGWDASMLVDISYESKKLGVSDLDSQGYFIRVKETVNG